MIAIIDYCVGNLFSLKSSLAALGLESCVTAQPETIKAADRIILPGVGAFGDAMAKLEETGLVPLIKAEAERKPLGLISGQVRALKDELSDKSLKVPHMGWNSLEIKKDDPIFKYFEEGEYVYYVHSFYAAQCEESTLATSDYGNLAVTGLVRRGKVWGSQFHPEKSGDAGLRLLKAFAEV